MIPKRQHAHHERTGKRARFEKKQTWTLSKIPQQQLHANCKLSMHTSRHGRDTSLRKPPSEETEKKTHHRRKNKGTAALPCSEAHGEAGVEAAAVGALLGLTGQPVRRSGRAVSLEANTDAASGAAKAQAAGRTDGGNIPGLGQPRRPPGAQMSARRRMSRRLGSRSRSGLP